MQMPQPMRPVNNGCGSGKKKPVSNIKPGWIAFGDTTDV